MKTLLPKGLAVLSLLVFPSVVAAQEQAATWRELLETRIRPAYRYTHPPAPRECEGDGVGSEGYLVTPGHTDPIGRTWLPGPNQSKWEPVRAPFLPDTLAVRIAAFWCGSEGRSVLVETDGYYLEIPEGQLARVDARGSLTAGVLWIPGAGGLTPARLQETCTGQECQLALADAAAYAEEVARQVAQREAADRARLAEADRRVAEQAAAPLRDGGAVQAQAAALAQQRRLEALQRYGATPEQADAIVAGRVLIGMSQGMVQAALGPPTSTRQEGTGAQRVVIWNYPTRSIVFVEGRVTEIR